MVVTTATMTWVQGWRGGGNLTSGNITSPILSKEVKSDRYKKKEESEKHGDSGLPDSFFMLQMKHALFICLIFLSSLAPKKDPTAPPPSFTLDASSPLFPSTSLCSSPSALTHWSASGWKNRGTQRWVC